MQYYHQLSTKTPEYDMRYGSFSSINITDYPYVNILNLMYRYSA